MEDARDKIVKRFLDENILLASNCFEKIIEHNADVEQIIDVAKSEEVFFVTDDFLDKFLIQNKQITEAAAEIAEPEASGVTVERSKSIFAKEIDSQLEIIIDSDVTDKSTSESNLASFVEYFNTKYSNISKILKQRVNFGGAITINALKRIADSDRTPVSIICMVRNKREGRTSHRFLEVEDPSGELTVMISGENQGLRAQYEDVLLDSVIGVEGVMYNDIFIAREITQPNLPVTKSMPKADEEVYIAFLSDLHIGSYLFQEREFDRFLKWINLKGDSPDIAGRVKYLFVAGDLVDGIGIYPTQEKELVIPDIYKQYDFLATLLEQIPDYIEIVLSVGNHDAVRNAQPQPRIPADIAPKLYALDNVHLVGNPVSVLTHGIKTLIYHGTSLDSIIGNLSSCNYRSPENAMIEYLKCRHLIPMYGSDIMAPESVDYMSIVDVPDILHCGHVHTNGYTTYRGVKVINSGTWQGKTNYQEQLGHVPTPARLPIMNLSNSEVKVLQFGE